MSNSADNYYTYSLGILSENECKRLKLYVPGYSVAQLFLRQNKTENTTDVMYGWKCVLALNKQCLYCNCRG